MPTETMERIYHTIDKTGWPDGPWMREADKISYRDEVTGLPCLIKRNATGILCGYVGVAPGHPAYGRDYHEVDVEVHGGLTYGAPCQDGPEEIAICHIPEPGEPDNVYWPGFDYRPYPAGSPFGSFGMVDSLFGVVDSMFAKLPEDTEPDVYRDVAYVREQNAHLAAQLAEMTK